MNKFLLPIAAAVSLLAGLSHAADLKVPPQQYKAPPVQQAYYDWSGFYLSGFFNFTSNVGANTTTIGNVAFDLNKVESGAGGGGGIMWLYQFQNSPWVLGLDADASWVGLRETAAITPPIGPQLINVTNKTDFLGNANGIIGYAIGQRALIGIEGGFGFGDVKPTLSLPGLCVALPLNCQTGNTTKVGYDVGGFIKYAAGDHFDIGLKTLYTHLDNQTLNIPGRIVTAPPLVSSTFKNDFIGSFLTFDWKVTGPY